VRVTWPTYVTLDCNACGKRWCADRITGAYVCSLDDFEHPREPTITEAIAAEEAIDPRDAVEPHSLFDLIDEGTGL